MNYLFILPDNGGCWIPLLTFIIYSQLDVESTSLSDASYDNSKQMGTYKNTSIHVLSIFIYVCPYTIFIKIMFLFVNGQIHPCTFLSVITKYMDERHEYQQNSYHIVF
jgi:hypothetical protein